MSMLWFVGGVLVLFALTLAYLASRLLSRFNDQDSGLEWLEDFSPQRYRPMERLFNENDFRFLESQPGYRPEIATALRAERKAIFRAYLNDLIADFQKLTYVGQLMVVYSEVDRSDLASEISRIRMQFYWRVVKTELWLAAGTPQSVHIPVGGLIEALERIEAGVRIGMALPAAS